jgi:hypothetical protein
MTMTTTTLVREQPAGAFLHVQSATRERLTHLINKETFCERVFITVTLGMAAFLSSVCYPALQHYGAW